jgi:multiple sugar transport system permease protein
MNAVILASINLLVVLLCACLLAHACARMHWRQSFGLVAVALLLWGAAWLVPQAISAFYFNDARLLFRLWFANWLVSAFGAVLLARMMARLPRAFEDTARMDGLGAFGTFRHVVFPYAKSIIVVTAVFTVMGTWMEFLRPVLVNGGNEAAPLGLDVNPRTGSGMGMLAAWSVLTALPVMVIAFLARGSARSEPAALRAADSIQSLSS